jgi:hypothetical protein
MLGYYVQSQSQESDKKKKITKIASRGPCLAADLALACA